MVLRRTPDHLTAILASSVLVFATALLAERMHASPVIAVVVVGLGTGRAARHALEPSRVIALQGFWEVAGFVINVVLFLNVGMQIEARSLISEAGSIGLALVALHAGRALAVYGSFGIVPSARASIPTRWQHVMVLGNIKGALSMAAVLALPEGLAYRPRLISIVFGVTFVTLITQALPFGRLLRALKVTLGSNPGEDHAKATLIAARRGQTELEDLLATGLVSRKDHAERRAELQRQVIEAELVLRARPDAAGLDPHVEVSLIAAQKGALNDATRRGLVDAEAAENLIAELDRRLLSATQHGNGEE